MDTSDIQGDLKDALPGDHIPFPDEEDKDAPASQLPGEYQSAGREGQNEAPEVLQPAAQAQGKTSTVEPQLSAEEKQNLDPTQAANLLDLLLSPEGPPDPPSITLVVNRPDGSFNVRVRLRGLSEREIESIGDRCWRDSTPRERKQGAGDQQRDMNRVMRLQVATAMIEPNLQDSRVLAAHGPTVEDVVQKWFLPGEIDQLSDKVIELSGWGQEALRRIKG